MRLNEKNNGAAFLFEHIQSADQIATFRSKVLWRRKWQQQRHQLWGEFQQRLNREKVQSSLDQEKEMNAPAAASPMGKAFFWWCVFSWCNSLSLTVWFVCYWSYCEMRCVYLHPKELEKIYGFCSRICFTHLEGFYDQTTRRSEESLVSWGLGKCMIVVLANTYRLMKS